MPKLKLYNNTTRLPYLGKRLDRLFYDLGFIYTGMSAKSLEPNLYLSWSKNKLCVQRLSDCIKVWDKNGTITIHLFKEKSINRKRIVAIIDIVKQNNQT